MKAHSHIVRCVAATLALFPLIVTPTPSVLAADPVDPPPTYRCGAEYQPGTSGGTLEGKLVDGSNAQPVANTRVVMCLTFAGSLSQSPTHLVATTDDQGRFSFAGLPRPEVCTVAPRGACTYTYFNVIALGTETRADLDTSETAWDGKTPSMTVQLHKSANISGQIIDSVAGYPVNDNIVILAHRNGSNGPQLAVDTPEIDRLAGAIFTTTLSPSGTYTLKHMPTGSFDIYVLPQNLNYSGEYIANVQTQRPFTTAGVNYLLKRTARVTGRVRNSRGDAIAGVSINLVSSNPGLDLGLKDITDVFVTDASGAFDFRTRARVAPQRLSISGTYPYLGQIVDQPITFAVGTNTQLTVTVYEPGLIRGSVRYASGRPALNHNVRLSDPTSRFANGTPGCDPFSVTDGNGNFTLCGIHPSGSYLVSASPINNPAGFIAGWHGGNSTIESAQPVTVQERQITAGIVITIPDPIYLPVVGRLSAQPPIPQPTE